MAIVVPILCFFLSSLLSLFFLRLSPVLGAVDLPDGVRKLHRAPTPRLGGMAIFSSFFLFSLLFLPKTVGVLSLLFGGVILVFSGFLDDTRTLAAGKKLLFQCLAAAGALALFGVPSDLRFLSSTLTLPIPLVAGFFFLFLVAAPNAVNFSDGADGLAAGCVLPSLLGLSLLFFSHGESAPAGCALLLFFALLGFLPFNRAPAGLFMGDAGSQFLGFAVAFLTFSDGRFSPSRLLFLALPLTDLCVTVGGRILRGKNPFRADREHLHHRLAARGASTGEIVLIATALSSAAAMLGVSLSL